MKQSLAVVQKAVGAYCSNSGMGEEERLRESESESERETAKGKKGKPLGAGRNGRQPHCAFCTRGSTKEDCGLLVAVSRPPTLFPVSRARCLIGLMSQRPEASPSRVQLLHFRRDQIHGPGLLAGLSRRTDSTRPMREPRDGVLNLRVALAAGERSSSQGRGGNSDGVTHNHLSTRDSRPGVALVVASQRRKAGRDPFSARLP